MDPRPPSENPTPRPRGQSEPVGLYDGPTLRAFRGWTLIALIAAAVTAGGALTLGAQAGLRWLQTRAVSTSILERPQVTRAGIEGKLRLTGPSGRVTLPGRAPTLVHIWLQGCADCMDAFEAMKQLDERVLGGVDVVNVAYGSVDAGFAETYRVDRRLVTDDGTQLVKPLGIGSFTTLLVDSCGRFRLWDRPSRPGFVDRVRGALAALDSAGPGPNCEGPPARSRAPTTLPLKGR